MENFGQSMDNYLTKLSKISIILTNIGHWQNLDKPWTNIGQNLDICLKIVQNLSNPPFRRSTTLVRRKTHPLTAIVIRSRAYVVVQIQFVSCNVTEQFSGSPACLCALPVQSRFSFIGNNTHLSIGKNLGETKVHKMLQDSRQVS